MPPDRASRRLDRSQLPAEFTPQTVRRMGMRTARQLANPDNGILTPTEQQAFDAALRDVMKASAERLVRSRGQHRGAPSDLDPDLRRSYDRTQQRLQAQAARARQAFPQLTEGWDLAEPSGPADEPRPPTVDEADPAAPTVDGVEAEATGEDVSLGTFEADVAQTSDMMEILEQIAGIQQQQLEHQRTQVLSETRGLFFALAVSVAVIVAGVAPLVEATPHQRRLILLWTAGVCTVAGCVYAVVRAVQQRSD